MIKNEQPHPLKNLIPSVLGFILIIASVTACTKPTPIVEAVPIPRAAPIVPSVTPLHLNEVQWVTITPENFKDIMASNPTTFYALDANGFEALSNNQLDIMKLVRQQKQVIATYEEWAAWTETN